MIALGTNALIRLLIEDDAKQARAVQQAVDFAHKASRRILVLPEVLIESVWVLESVYQCTREEIVQFLETVHATSTFALTDYGVVGKAIQQYRHGGDFADLIIIEQAKKHGAALFSFDEKLQKRFPDFVTEKPG